MLTKLLALLFSLVYGPAILAQNIPFATAADAGTFPYNASPSALASTNTAAIQAALNANSAGGLVTLSNCSPNNGVYQVNAPLTISSNTRLLLAPCVTLQQTAGNTPNNMIQNKAYMNRGYLSAGPTYASGASGCTNGTQYVTFTNGSGYGAYGQINVTSNVPSGSVTVLNPGAWYTAPPNQGVVTTCNNNYALTGATSNSGTTTYLGNIAVCPPVGYGTDVTISGLASSANNGIFAVTACSAGVSVTLANPLGITETHSGTAVVPQPITFSSGSATGSLASVTSLTNSYSITSVANHSGSNTTYTGNIGVCPPTGGSGGISMSGFAQQANTGLFQLVSCTIGTPGTLVVNNGSGVTDTTGTASLGTDVIVTWPTSHGFTAGLSWVAIWGFSLVSSPTTSGFAGVFQVESVIDATHFTYRMLRLPTANPGGTILGLTPDTNITIEGGTFDYNGPALTAPAGYPPGYPTGYNVGDAIILLAAQNTEIRDAIIKNASQNGIYDAMTRDFYVSRTTDNGHVSQQLIKSVGPAFNAKVEKITSFGADDTVTWMSDDVAYPTVGAGFPQVGLSRGDVINAGCEHIDRALTYSASSGICDFFFGATAYMGGVYAKNITGTIPLGGTNSGGGCVDFGSNGIGAFLDTALVENINCNATWSVHVGSGTGQAYKFNGIDIHGITCNQPDSNGGQVGETCVAMDSLGTGQRMTVNALTAGFQGNTYAEPYIAIGGTLSELNITNATLNSNGFGSPSCTGGAFPAQLVLLLSGANVGKLNIDKAVQPCGNAAVQIYPGAGALSYALTAAGNQSGGITTYTGTFSPIVTSGIYVTISGFTNAGNNGTFLVNGNSTGTFLTVNNPGGVAETHAGTALTPTTVTISSSNISATSAIITSASANITLKDNVLSNQTSPVYVNTTSSSTIALNVQTQGNTIAGGNGNWLCWGGGATCNLGSGLTPIINWDDRGNLTPNMGYPPAVTFGAGGDTCLFAAFPSISGFGAATLNTGSNNCGFVITTSSSPSGNSGTFTFPVTARTGWYCTYNAGAITYSLTAAGNQSGGVTAYTGTFSPIITSGVYVTISGFANPGNNGTFLVNGNSTGTSLTVNNSGGVAETHAATALTATNVIEWTGSTTTTWNAQYTGMTWPANTNIAFSCHPR